jgi:MFS family permease
LSFLPAVAARASFDAISPSYARLLAELKRKGLMRKRQLLALFICSLVLWTVGNGLVPLLPVYAVRLGADPAAAGYYLAFSNLALAVGAITAGWLSDRLKRRKLPFIIVTLASIPLSWLMGRAGNIWSLSLLTAVLWACGGLGLTMVAILTGLSAGEHERGQIFGILSLTSGLGALIGGLTTGFIADRWGYPAMFSAVAVFMLLAPLAGLFLTESVVEPGQVSEALAGKKLSLGRSYHLLFFASLVASVAGFIIVLVRSLHMSDLEFGALAISSTGAVGGLVALPIPLIMGWLSDRTGRKRYLYLAYLASIASLLVLAVATSLWNFFIVSILQTIFVGINATVGNAWVADLVPPGSLGRGLALFGTTAWIGGILGFAGAGYALQSLGRLPTLFIGICLLLIAVVLLIPIRSEAERRAAIAGPGTGAT